VHASVTLLHPCLEEQVALTLKPQTRLHEHLEPITLPSERIHNIRTGLDKRRLEHVTEQAEHRVQGCVGRRDLAIVDAREELGENCDVED
jgi:hypothetical protein